MNASLSSTSYITMNTKGVPCEMSPRAFTSCSTTYRYPQETPSTSVHRHNQSEHESTLIQCHWFDIGRSAMIAVKIERFPPPPARNHAGGYDFCCRLCCHTQAISRQLLRLFTQNKGVVRGACELPFGYKALVWRQCSSCGETLNHSGLNFVCLCSSFPTLVSVYSSVLTQDYIACCTTARTPFPRNHLERVRGYVLENILCACCQVKIMRELG